MPNTLEDNFAFEKSMMPQVKELLKKHAAHIIRIDTATEEQDTQQATDLVLRVDSGTIAVRVRDLDTFKNKAWRDLTIRTQVRSGGRTEIHKLRDGWGDWYFYAWAEGATRGEKRIKEYMLLDIHKIRAKGLLEALEQKRAIPNDDGTFFKPISLQELLRNECVVVHTANGYAGKFHTANKQVVLDSIAAIQAAAGALMNQVEPATVQHSTN